MINHSICIFCDAELTPTTKPEHILLNALGGRKTTRRVICSEHNNTFGNTIDGALSKQVEVLRNMLQLESGTGNPPPALKNREAGSEQINISNNGRPELIQPQFTVTELPNGGTKVEIHFQTPEAIKKIIPNLAAKLRIPEEQLIERMKNGKAVLVERRPGQMHHSISFGGEAVLRSVAKACLVLLATVTGNELLKAEPFAKTRGYVLNGGAEFNKARIQINSRNVPGLADFEEEFGPFLNLIYVRSNDVGRVIGHFTLYNTISWQIVLAEEKGPPNVTAAIISNPLTPSIWCDNPIRLPDIPFDWLDAIEDRVYEVEQVRERIVTMMQYHAQQSRESEITRICNDAFVKHGVMENNQPINDPELQEKNISYIADRMAMYALGLPCEYRFRPEEIEAMLNEK